MGQSKTYGAAPKPDAEDYAYFKDCGKHLAEMARSSKRSRTSVNLRGKIESYIRKAINIGMDVFEEEQHVFDRPSKADVTKWVKIRAQRVMSSTAYDRKGNRMWEFGSAVTQELVSAFKKGWSLGAGQTTIGNPSGKTSASELISHVPTKYYHTWELMCLRKVKQETEGYCSHPDTLRLLYVEEVHPFNGKSYWFPALLCRVNDPDPMLEIRELEGVAAKAGKVSGGCMNALMKRGLTELKVSTNDVRVADLTMEAMDLFRRINEAVRDARKATYASTAGQKRLEDYNNALASVGETPISAEQTYNFEEENIRYYHAWQVKIANLKA